MRVTSSIIVISLPLMAYKNFMRCCRAASTRTGPAVVGTEWGPSSDMTRSVMSHANARARALGPFRRSIGTINSYKNPDSRLTDNAISLRADVARYITLPARVASHFRNFSKSRFMLSCRAIAAR